MSVDKSWGRGAGLSLSAAHIQRDMHGRDAEENRAAVPTLVYGHLELTIQSVPWACAADHGPIECDEVTREADHLLLTNREVINHSCHATAFQETDYTVSVDGGTFIADMGSTRCSRVARCNGRPSGKSGYF
ncbi:hypothetical protein Y032_0048g1730 [Ancylostoma ceylanicum]|uniref:Uncharacterized protein n=1 Tax=Ancylostoma ceylanicum TaxID=53326 RepID=A0A016UBV7_9BILA|nr:hypothetical protein Y032_0048g1730 [Ancylostoma ceylanicum]